MSETMSSGLHAFATHRCEALTVPIVIEDWAAKPEILSFNSLTTSTFALFDLLKSGGSCLLTGAGQSVVVMAVN